MVEKCIKCDKTGEQVKLLDGISPGQLVRICEQCAETENLPIIKRPTTTQLRESERNYTVYERLRKMAGLPGKKEGEKLGEKEKGEELAKKIKSGEVTLDDLRKKGKEEELKEEREGYVNEKEQKAEESKPLNLIDNFHWHIMLARKKKKLTRKELANLLAESETAIKMIENKEMPEDAFKLIAKLEQFFGIKLRAEKEVKEEKAEEERIREAIKERLEREKKEKRERVEEAGEEKPVLKFDSETVKRITIADLRRMREEKKQAEEKAEKERQEKERQEKIAKLKEELERLETGKGVEETRKETEEKEKPEEAEKFLGNEIELID